MQITVSFSNNDDAESLMALLSNSGFEGFEEKENELLAYIHEDDCDAAAIIQLKTQFDFSYGVATLQNKNWNEEWEKNFQPVAVDDFVYVRADFHEANTSAQHEIIITPKMSFGTGHHATTYMMMQAMREIDFTGKTIFDFGTGTGILAIFAEKLGAEKIIATDNDEWSIANAKENIERNNCSKIDLKPADEIIPGSYDIMLANINKNVILHHFAAMAKQLNSNAHLLVSGILEEDKQEILGAAQQLQLKFADESSQDKWACIKFLANAC